MQERDEWGPVPHEEDAHPFRPSDLVTGGRQEVDRDPGHVDRDLPHRLRRVGVHDRALRLGEVREPGDRQDEPRLVVHPHDRDHRAARLQACR